MLPPPLVPVVEQLASNSVAKAMERYFMMDLRKNQFVGNGLLL
jgi:hypothetical protein